MENELISKLKSEENLKVVGGLSAQEIREHAKKCNIELSPDISDEQLKKSFKESLKMLKQKSNDEIMTLVSGGADGEAPAAAAPAAAPAVAPAAAPATAATTSEKGFFGKRWDSMKESTESGWKFTKENPITATVGIAACMGAGAGLMKLAEYIRDKKKAK